MSPRKPDVRGKLTFDKGAAIQLLQEKGATPEELAKLEKRGAGHVQVRELKP